MEIQQIIIIGLLTGFFSFGVQVCFYFWYRFTKNPLIALHKHVFNYKSGVIGDGVIIPFTNIFAANVIHESSLNYKNSFIWMFALVCGYILTYFFHFGQKYYRLTNWTMPEVGNWNLLGVYHAIFMFCESSFLFYVLISYLSYGSKISISVNSSMLLGLLLLVIFFLLFMNDYWKPLFKNLAQKALNN